MTPPITQCLNGHNVCSKCIQELFECPVCREALNGTTSRNLFAENMAEKGKFPCKNADDGCNQIMKLSELQLHKPVCPYRVYKC
ncbi:E3 ubiquitin-protein ligase SIAH2, partial [Blattella germanica]